MNMPRRVSCAGEAARLARARIRDWKKEHCVGLYLNGGNVAAAVELVSMGVVDGTFIHPREVFRPAILHAAVAVVVVHNHPSGDLTPSQADLSLTERLRLVGELLGIPLLDHVVIGEDGGFRSIRDVRPWETPQNGPWRTEAGERR